MTTRNNKLTRRTALTRFGAIGGLTVAAQADALAGMANTQGSQPEPPAPAPAFGERIPVTGKAGPALEPFDVAMLGIMNRNGIPGAALAVAKDGKLVLAKGYGWANVTTGEPVKPDTLFGLASLSKPITAAATLKLVEQGKLGLDDPVLGHINDIKPPAGAQMDPRLLGVTVRQCLNHSGGWNRNVKGDPVNWEPQICRAFGVPPPLSPAQFLSFTLGLPLDFQPGTDAIYSNIGFIILGEIIARLSGQPYEQFVIDNVLKPMGITRARLHPREGRYLAGEAYRHLSGTLTTLPAMRLPMVDATGGWSGSVVDLARFLTNLEGTRGEPALGEETRRLMLQPPPGPLKPRENGTYFGLGWDSVMVDGTSFGYFKDGSYQGMRTFMKRLPVGISWALLYNASMDFDPVDMEVAGNTVREIRQLVERFDQYPDIDLFEEFP